MFENQFIGINDFNGNPIHEGDEIQWPYQKETGIIRYEINSCQFRIQMDDGYSLNVGLNVGKKGMATIVKKLL